MNNVIKIFTTDVKRLVRSPLALIIALGLCALPALYAWFNIYSNWDPYANTSNIKIAVASNDIGYTDEAGEYKNMGDSVLESLAESTSINWILLEDSQMAIDGVYSGDYYAAVVINEDFSYCMYNFFDNNFENPVMTYYENEKKNAVATKITDTAVGTLKTTINSEFINVVASTIFEGTNAVSSDVKDSEAIDSLYSKLTSLRENLASYGDTIDLFLAGNEDLQETLVTISEDLSNTKASIETTTAGFQSANSSLSATQGTLNNFGSQVSSTLGSITEALNDMSATLSNTNLANDSQSMISAIATVNADIATITNQIDALSNLLLKAQADGYTGDYAGALASIALMKVSINQIGAAVAAFATASASSAGTMTSVQIQATLSSASAAINDASSQVETIRTNLVNNLIPQLNQMCGSLSNMLSNVTDIMNSLSDTLGSMDIIFSSIDSTIEETGSSLSQVAASIDEIIAQIDNVISWMDGLDEDEKLDMVTSFLGGDAESYGKFFSEPVTVNTQAIYPVESYGCAVTPFYTILALWVGGTLLVSLIKVKAEGENLKDVTHAQLFFGRYLLFFFLGQLQAAIIVIGDIYLLHCQVLYHGMFFVVAALSSFTFTLLIYSLTISFGDIGKALAVIFMVLQIAGSSGTFPIELLPEFYQKVYIFFPFPYAINAMRETVAGLYGMTYAENLVKLMLFAVAALVIGLVIRIPFIKVNHYMEKRMEDTKMM